MRIHSHPILDFEEKEDITFMFEGKQMVGKKGDTIASALVNLGIDVFSYSIKLNRPRGFYCAIGNCASCKMKVNGKPNIKTCITKLEPNMVVERQTNKGEYK
ncbi:MAG: (2Fe-2S)-binding protein [Acholeplasmataceae bacterium]